MIRIKNAAFGFVFKSNILIAALLFSQWKQFACLSEYKARKGARSFVFMHFLEL